MKETNIDPRGKAVRKMFDGIAGRYDRMNRLMTFGRDARWRRCVIRHASIPRGGRLLDVATGTGDIAMEAVGRDPAGRVVGIDFSTRMLAAAKRRCRETSIQWCCGDALQLPFPDCFFDAVTSGFLVRNVTDPRQAFREQRRVLRPGGTVVCLDTSPPPLTWMHPWIDYYFQVVIPFLGSIFGDSRQAYLYLTESTRGFKSPSALAADMQAAGLRPVSCRRFMLGTVVVITGTRPKKPGEKCRRETTQEN